MSQESKTHAWWSRLRHQGLLLSPIVMLERYPSAPEPPPFPATDRLRDAHVRFISTAEARQSTDDEIERSAILNWVDRLLEQYVGHGWERVVKRGDIPEKLSAVIRIGGRSETLKPHRVIYADASARVPALLVMADASPTIGRGRGRTKYAQLLELLRGTGHRLGLLTNGRQFRLVYAGLDFESWCEWESDRWFDDGEGSEELAGLRQLLSPESLSPAKEGVSGLLDAIEESRKRQADLSSVLRENVRQAIEFLLEDVSAANRTEPALFQSLKNPEGLPSLTDAQAYESLYQATVRVVMRLVVCLFAESRGLLPTGDPIYDQAYGVRPLYELLEEAVRAEGGLHALFNRNTAWPRLMALFRLIHEGSYHGAFPMRAYGGALFRPGDATSDDPVSRALHILEHAVPVGDDKIHAVLRKLLRGPLPVLQGRRKISVEGPVDYTELRTEFIGLIYEGLLDYRIKRADEEIGPQVFLNIGREPVLPLRRLEAMLDEDERGLKNLLTTLGKEKVTAAVAVEDEPDSDSDTENDEESADDQDEAGDDELDAPSENGADVRHGGDYVDALEAAKRWARRAAVVAGLVGKQRKSESDGEHQARIEAEANRLIKRVVATGEFYLVRAGNTRKGTGTFYTRPQLAVPTVHRALSPLCYSVIGGSWLVVGEEGGGDGADALSRIGGVADGDGPGDDGLSAHERVPEGRNLRPAESGPSGGGVDSLEHRRGAGEEDHQGIPPSSFDRSGTTSGGSDPNRDRAPARISDTGPTSGDRAAGELGRTPPQRPDERPGSQAPGQRTLIPKTPEEILSLKVCDPACGSASFLVAALHYLTDALYKSLCFHRGLEDPSRSGRITLPYGHPRSHYPSSPTTSHQPPTTEELLPFAPDDKERGDTFEDRVKALLRRHVVERCIYGVDINPLAVELARVSLWVETLDPELPFSFLDHKIRVGNALVGCWLDRVEDYPLRAWEREGGDGPKGERTRRLKAYLKGDSPAARESTSAADGPQPPTTSRQSPITDIKREMRKVIETRFQDQPQLFPEMGVTAEAVVADARADYEKLHALPMDTDPDERERFYREHILGSPALQRLRRAMDEWCAVWFWPSDEEALRHVPTPASFHSVVGGSWLVVGRDPNASDPTTSQAINDHLATDTPTTNHQPPTTRQTIIDRLAAALKFFHWELEYPDVFTPDRSGFDAMIGNPPWDVMKPNSQEFFTDYDPLYRTYDKQKALKRQRAMFDEIPGVLESWEHYNAHFKAMSNWAGKVGEPFNMTLARGKEGSSLASSWAKRRQERRGFADPEHPFRIQGSADLNSYKMFAEAAYRLCHGEGRIGMIVPSGIYSDYGTKELRETFLMKSAWEWVFMFENKHQIFDIHRSFKFGPVIVDRRPGGNSLRAAFMVHNLEEWERATPDALHISPEDVRLNSPKTLSLVELRSKRDLDIFRKIYAHSIRIGDNAPGWEITYATEFHMTNDSKLFPPLEQWEAKSYKPDVFGRWIGPEGDVALPLYQGAMIHQYNPILQQYESGEAGQSRRWQTMPLDDLRFCSRYLIAAKDAAKTSKESRGGRFAFRDIARSTDERTFIGTVIPDLPCGNTAPILSFGKLGIDAPLLFSAVASSFACDYTARIRLTGTHMNFFVLQELPTLFRHITQDQTKEVVLRSARLTFLHRRFAPEWLKLAHLYPETFGFDPLVSLPTTNHQPPTTANPTQWKHWWAVTEADRLRARVEIDALCAELYGLDPDDFDWIVRDDPTDPKGFYRVDRQLPFRERLTGLAAAAFRALKEGRWLVGGGSWLEGKDERPTTNHQSPTTELTNDEFFDLLGIPELTSAEAAQALGLPGPLIEKRDGCHVWRPESFPPEDPRHGWTWTDCWNDAVALLGGDEAVRAYIAGNPTSQAPEPEWKLRPPAQERQNRLFRDDD